MSAPNPYAGLPYEALKALRRDLMNIRVGHIREAERCMAEARRVGHAMGDATREPIGISDHAIVRWLERARGVDVAAIREEIVSHIAEHDSLGDSHLVIGNGLVVRMEANRVLTVMPVTIPSAQGGQGPTDHAETANHTPGMNPNPPSDFL